MNTDILPLITPHDLHQTFDSVWNGASHLLNTTYDSFSSLNISSYFDDTYEYLRETGKGHEYLAKPALIGCSVLAALGAAIYMVNQFRHGTGPTMKGTRRVVRQCQRTLHQNRRILMITALSVGAVAIGVPLLNRWRINIEMHNKMIVSCLKGVKHLQEPDAQFNIHTLDNVDKLGRCLPYYTTHDTVIEDHYSQLNGAVVEAAARRLFANDRIFCYNYGYFVSLSRNQHNMSVVFQLCRQGPIGQVQEFVNGLFEQYVGSL